MLFERTEYDKKFYDEKLRDFLPDTFIDDHTHVWLDKFMTVPTKEKSRSVTWPSLVAKDNSIEDLMETYRIMFPGKTVKPVIFSEPKERMDLDAGNAYIESAAKKYGLYYLLLAHPSWSASDFEAKLLAGGYYGAKVYLNYSPAYIPTNEIRIFDFVPHSQLEILNKHSMVLMLHIPRPLRLRDPVNLAQMLEIERKYPNIKLIIAHVGRAYCDHDVGNAFEVLAETKNMCFDITANTNAHVFAQLIDAVGPKRILFGSDLPILRMRSRRIERDGHYVNLVPRGAYGDLSGDPNMDELDKPESDSLTYFMYEEIEAFRQAALSRSLSRSDIEDVFRRNAERLFSRS